MNSRGATGEGYAYLEAALFVDAMNVTIKPCNNDDLVGIQTGDETE